MVTGLVEITNVVANEDDTLTAYFRFFTLDNAGKAFVSSTSVTSTDADDTYLLTAIDEAFPDNS